MAVRTWFWPKCAFLNLRDLVLHPEGSAVKKAVERVCAVLCCCGHEACDGPAVEFSEAWCGRYRGGKRSFTRASWTRFVTDGMLTKTGRAVEQDGPVGTR